MESFINFLKKVLIAGYVIYALSLIWAIYLYFTESPWFAHTALFHVLLWGVLLINFNQYGRREATIRIIIFALLGSAALSSGWLALFVDLSFILYYQWIWLLAITVGLLWPSFDSLRTISEKPYRNLLVLFIGSIFCGIGSIYVPMRASANAVYMRLNDPVLYKQIASDTEKLGPKEAMTKFQMNYLYEKSKKEDTWCSIYIRNHTSAFLYPDTMPLHRTVSFWIQQYLNGVWGLQNVAGCWISDLEPRRRFEENWFAVQGYSAFLNLFWTSMLLNILFKIIFHPVDRLRSYAHEKLTISLPNK